MRRLIGSSGSGSGGGGDDLDELDVGALAVGDAELVGEGVGGALGVGGDEGGEHGARARLAEPGELADFARGAGAGSAG